MKIDRNTRTPLYTPSELPAKLKDFAYIQAPKSDEYRNNFDNIKWDRPSNVNSN